MKQSICRNFMEKFCKMCPCFELKKQLMYSKSRHATRIKLQTKIWLKFIPINKIFKTAKQIANKMDSTINYPTTRLKT